MKDSPLMIVHQNLSDLSLDDLREVQEVVGECIHDKELEAKKKNTKTRAQIIKEFQAFGFEIPPDAKLFKINGPSTKEGYGAYGWQVGQYTHSCHIDSTDLLVLLVVDGHDNFVESYADLWLDAVV